MTETEAVSQTETHRGRDSDAQRGHIYQLKTAVVAKCLIGLYTTDS